MRGKPDREGKYPLYMVLAKRGRRAMSTFGIRLLPEQWKDGKVVDHPDCKLLNNIISVRKADFERAIFEMTYMGLLAGKDAGECMNLILESVDPERVEERKRRESRKGLFMPYYDSFAASKVKKGTRDIYQCTAKVLRRYFESCGGNEDTLHFDDMNRQWLQEFDSFCLLTMSRNSASIHLRNIRAAFNAAIDDGQTTNYPFRRFKIRYEPTRDKSCSVEQLRALFTYQTEVPGEIEAIDMFKLMFMLIGINRSDFAACGKPSGGRVDYVRMKTGKLYSIKLEPEAFRIVSKYAGKEHLVNIAEKASDSKSYFHNMVRSLRKVGTVQVSGKKSKGKPIIPDITTGSARTSWATIAQQDLDIPRDVIAAALGHHTVDVTSTYLRTDWRMKVDAANRRVVDWVLYGRR